MGIVCKAIVGYTQVIQLNPTDIQAYYERSAMYRRKGDLAKARAIGVANLKELVKKSPLAQEIVYNIVAFFNATGRAL